MAGAAERDRSNERRQGRDVRHVVAGHDDGVGAERIQRGRRQADPRRVEHPPDGRNPDEGAGREQRTEVLGPAQPDRDREQRGPEVVGVEPGQPALHDAPRVRQEDVGLLGAAGIGALASRPCARRTAWRQDTAESEMCGVASSTSRDTCRQMAAWTTAIPAIAAVHARPAAQFRSRVDGGRKPAPRPVTPMISAAATAATASEAPSPNNRRRFVARDWL